MYDVTLRTTGDGWAGTFAVIVKSAALDILSDGEPWGPVEVIHSTEPAVTGTLQAVVGDDLVIQTGDNADALKNISIDEVLMFQF